VFATDDAPDVNICDPDHGTQTTLNKVFGADAAAAGDYSTPTMEGFAAGESGADNCDVMRGLTPDKVPILTALASEYAVMDRFFASHAGPTWPNRMYMLSATTRGDTATNCMYNMTNATCVTGGPLRSRRRRPAGVEATPFSALRRCSPPPR